MNELAASRLAEIDPLSPYARFEIPSKKVAWEYCSFLDQSIRETLIKQNKRNEYIQISLAGVSGDEGGIGYCRINDDYIVGCKLYWFDGESKTPGGWQKGCLFRDHEDKGCYTVHQILLLADAFAEFLTLKEIPFIFYVRLRTDRQDIIRAKFPK